MKDLLPQLVDLIQSLIYCATFIFALKYIRTKRTKKLSIKFMKVAIITEYFDN